MRSCLRFGRAYQFLKSFGAARFFSGGGVLCRERAVPPQVSDI